MAYLDTREIEPSQELLNQIKMKEGADKYALRYTTNDIDIVIILTVVCVHDDSHLWFLKLFFLPFMHYGKMTRVKTNTCFWWATIYANDCIVFAKFTTILLLTTVTFTTLLSSFYKR